MPHAADDSHASIDLSGIAAGGHTGPYTKQRQPHVEPETQIRSADQEPYIGLRYLSRLFKLMATVLILLLIAEVVTGLVASGVEALPTLLGEVSRLIVFAGILWGSGDLAILLIDIGHDLRATRILIGRQLAHHTSEHHANIDPAIVPQIASDATAGINAT